MANPLLIPIVATVAVVALLKKKPKTAGAQTQEPELVFDDTPSPPLLGATPCYGSYLSKSNGALSNDVLSLMNAPARAYVTPPNGRRIWASSDGQVHVYQPATTRLTAQGQVAAYKMALAILRDPSKRSLNSDVARTILKSLMPECDWDKDMWVAAKLADRDTFTTTERNLFTSVWYLVQAAAHHINYKVGGPSPSKHLMVPKPSGGSGLVIGRGYLTLPDVAAPGSVNLEPGRRLELLVGDYRKGQWPRPPFFHGERVYARVVESVGGRPTVEILGTFRGEDVAPKFAYWHGFSVGRWLKLPGSGTTAIQRVFPPGLE